MRSIQEANRNLLKQGQNVLLSSVSSTRKTLAAFCCALEMRFLFAVGDTPAVVSNTQQDKKERLLLSLRSIFLIRGADNHCEIRMHCGDFNIWMRFGQTNIQLTESYEDLRSRVN